VKRFPFQASKKGDLLPFQPTRFTMLGVWILAAGLVMTLFHTVQGLAAFRVAESLCYLDPNGVAVPVGLHYFDTLGLPSRRVLLHGLPGLVCTWSLCVRGLYVPKICLVTLVLAFSASGGCHTLVIEGHAQQRQSNTPDA
jgi:hypothetical protein